MSKKETAIFIAIVVIFFFGLVNLLRWDATNDAKGRQERCKEIAQLAKSDDYIEKNYQCFIINDNKLVQVEL